jgi:hypothetical protein
MSEKGGGGKIKLGARAHKTNSLVITIFRIFFQSHNSLVLSHILCPKLSSFNLINKP